MKYLRLFEKASDYEAAKSALDVPNVSYVEETQECHFIGGGDDTVIRLYKTNCGEDSEYRNEVDYDMWYEPAGTCVVDGKTYYKWNKSFRDEFEEIITAGYGIITDTLDYSAASLQNPISVVGVFTNDSPADSYKTSDMIILSVEASKRTIAQYPEKHDTSTLNKNGQAYVDLGLPSGTLWAKCNVGASKESDYGGYYQWGGTVDYTSTAKTCNWTTYPYGTDSNALTKYNLKTDYGTVDNKTELELSDDVAHQIMGGDWHMPSVLHIKELYQTPRLNGRRLMASTVEGSRRSSTAIRYSFPQQGGVLVVL